ncbi:uncharacterized protein SCHCODRAFT_01038723 [Schizophyllum commune H4-8]|uniref:uncharacterized protein n=1 Tax=Schizophyllum commune (strain H4-8 / FGSC 9210) TaxID=578458 RepID=UPI00215E084A|nr:uncharacterized protein SCHCODRAFT_01038723 [Schizophyllum commune H4-8]KAI5891795.1 hypothetical protein SCHCODRAFT_01038723 [Schizophyllum commune H4-8]
MWAARQFGLQGRADDARKLSRTHRQEYLCRRFGSAGTAVHHAGGSYLGQELRPLY